MSDTVDNETTEDETTHAERMLALIEQRLEGRITSDHESYTIEGRSLTRIPFAELREYRKYYRKEVYNIQQARGLKPRFRRVKYL